jgi:UDP-N-acetylmuramoylalanine--D-glutamate ligase
MSQRLVILGGGESGVGAALLAKQKGWDVLLSDNGNIAPGYQEELKQHNIPFEERGHTEEHILLADEVVKSPGIPDQVPLIQKLRAKGVPVISEIEFAGRYASGRKICITGSNGKTTTTMLIQHLLRNAGVNVAMAGNVGVGFARQVAKGVEPDWWVLELSSFQLDGMYDFRADVAILLNITPDHLDRYNYEMQRYVASKLRIIQNQTPADIFIYCQDDVTLREALQTQDIKAVQLPFSIEQTMNEGACIEGDQLIINYKGEPMSLFTQELALKGRHNLYNSMAAGIVAKVIKIRKKVIRDSLASFTGVEHRLEKVSLVRGIEFINDSKATNVNSTWYALECMEKPVLWIAGGIDKGNDYADLAQLVMQKVKVLICMGKDNQKLVSFFEDKVPTIIETQSMEEAVKSAYLLGEKGDVVLLSPACASFDLFKNYEQRGQQFKEAVRAL